MTTIELTRYEKKTPTPPVLYLQGTLWRDRYE